MIPTIASPPTRPFLISLWRTAGTIPSRSPGRISGVGARSEAEHARLCQFLASPESAHSPIDACAATAMIRCEPGPLRRAGTNSNRVQQQPMTLRQQTDSPSDIGDLNPTRCVDEEVEPRIRDLVRAMNAIPSVQTVASCQGHCFRDMPPYVFFVAPESVAACIEKILRGDAISEHPKLQEFWCVKGIFDDSFSLKYYLYSPLLHRRGFFRRFRLTDRRLGRDFSVLLDFMQHVL